MRTRLEFAVADEQLFSPAAAPVLRVVGQVGQQLFWILAALGSG